MGDLESFLRSWECLVKAQQNGRPHTVLGMFKNWGYLPIS